MKNDYSDTERLMLSINYAEGIFINQGCSDKPANVQQMLRSYYKKMNELAVENPEQFRFKTFRSSVWQNSQTES